MSDNLEKYKKQARSRIKKLLDSELSPEFREELSSGRLNEKLNKLLNAEGQTIDDTAKRIGMAFLDYVEIWRS